VGGDAARSEDLARDLTDFASLLDELREAGPGRTSDAVGSVRHIPNYTGGSRSNLDGCFSSKR
jgi:hypothetical protein